MEKFDVEILDSDEFIGLKTDCAEFLLDVPILRR